MAYLDHLPWNPYSVKTHDFWCLQGAWVKTESTVEPSPILGWLSIYFPSNERKSKVNCFKNETKFVVQIYSSTLKIVKVQSFK